MSHNEPTQDWTIEELLQWCHQRSQLQISSKTDELISALQQVYDNAEQEIWELHRMAVQNTTDETDTDTDADAEVGTNENANADTENIAPSNNNIQVHNHNDASTSIDPLKAGLKNQNENETERKAKKGQFYNLFIEVQTGPHEGATYLLKPRSSRPCEIGRSKGKKFQQKGVSLFKDSEVSTCHGKFEYKAGRMYYTDTGSTNGTSFMGEAIEDNVQMEIICGMVLGFGDSDLKFTIVDN